MMNDTELIQDVEKEIIFSKAQLAQNTSVSVRSRSGFRDFRIGCRRAMLAQKNEKHMIECFPLNSSPVQSDIELTHVFTASSKKYVSRNDHGIIDEITCRRVQESNLIMQQNENSQRLSVSSPNKNLIYEIIEVGSEGENSSDRYLKSDTYTSGDTVTECSSQLINHSSCVYSSCSELESVNAQRMNFSCIDDIKRSQTLQSSTNSAISSQLSRTQELSNSSFLSSQRLRKSSNNFSSNTSFSHSEVQKHGENKEIHCESVSQVKLLNKKDSTVKLSRIDELSRHKNTNFERECRPTNNELDLKECTFKPAINATQKFKRNLNGRVRAGDNIPVHDRLMKSQKEKKERLQEKIAQNESIISDQCSFAPHLISKPNHKNLNKVPIYRRVWEIQRCHEHKLRELEHEFEDKSSYVPNILQKSINLALNSRSMYNDGNSIYLSPEHVYDRLLLSATRSKEKFVSIESKYLEKEMENNTFEPKLCEGTKQLVLKRPELRLSFDERQAKFAERSRFAEQVQMCKAELEAASWFHPSTTEKSDAIIRRCMPERLNENELQRVYRMADLEVERRQIHAIQLAQEEQKKYPFTPVINPFSTAFGPSTASSLHNEKNRKQHVKWIEVEMNAECTFKPYLVAESKKFEGRDIYGPDNKYRLGINEPWLIAENLKMKAEIRETEALRIKAEREVAEMQDCTFTPIFSASIPTSYKPVFVHGTDRHMELRKAANRVKADRIAREAAAFSVKPCSQKRNPDGMTHVVPFQLSGEGVRMKWEARRIAIEEQIGAYKSCRSCRKDNFEDVFL